MAKLYLITGFLGAGKTTLLKNLITVLSNYRLHVIVNEFGKEGIDGQLLCDTRGILDEINNGSIFCSCRLDKFEEILTKAIVQQPDIILVETSGLSDPANARTLLGNYEKFDQLEFKGSICLVDACNFNKVYQTAAVVKKQIAVSDLAIINKIDLADEKRINEIKAALLTQNPGIMIKQTSYGVFEERWLTELAYAIEKKETCDTHLMQQMDITLKKLLLVVTDEFTCYQMEKFIRMFLADTYRIKGFIRMEGKIYLLNCVSNMYKAELYDQTAKNINHIVVLSGNGMPIMKRVKEAVSWYQDKIIKVE